MMLAPAQTKPPTENRKSTRTRAAARQHQLDLFRARPRGFDRKRLVQIATRIWAASRPVAGTLGEQFFITRRLAVPDSDVVRFHTSLKFGDRRAPGLLGLLRDQRTGEPCGVVRVFLDGDGSTVLGKRILGRGIGSVITRAPRPP